MGSATKREKRTSAGVAKRASEALCAVADSSRVPILQRFFKTGPGEYAEGDVFIGATVPQVRTLVKEFGTLPLSEVRALIRSRIHEERLLGLLILVRQYERGDEKTRDKIFRLYTTHFKWINNWDLVDATAEHIIAPHLSKCGAERLDAWARSRSVWQRRIAIMSTFHLIKRKEYADTLRIAEILLHDEHDLIHKAVGWMLREIGKRNQAVEERFLRKHYKHMPRTMLRYAIERFPESLRQAYLKGRVAR